MELVAVYKIKRGHRYIKKVNDRIAAICKIAFREVAVLISLMPYLIDPHPGSIVHVYEILIIKMDSRY
jgi:hypothetical protein